MLSAVGLRWEVSVTEWTGAAEAAERLGIKTASLYAYVSRGELGRRRDADGRASLFDADEVEELARHERPRRAATLSELAIESQLTEITPGSHRYRGYKATDLALQCSFEEVALLLWTDSVPTSLAVPGNSKTLTRHQSQPSGVRHPRR
jgi:citrate synthase